MSIYDTALVEMPSNGQAEARDEEGCAEVEVVSPRLLSPLVSRHSNAPGTPRGSILKDASTPRSSAKKLEFSPYNAVRLIARER